MALFRLTVVLVSALMISMVTAFPPIDNQGAVVAERKLNGKQASGSTAACLSEGGMCVITSQCPKDKLSSKKGLCGTADKECCHSLPDNIVNCEERGGICRLSTECKGAARDPVARCDAGHVCCILIR